MAQGKTSVTERAVSVETFNRRCTETLDKGVDTFRSISELHDLSTTVRGRKSGELEMALPEMESVVVHLASELTGGDLDRTRSELEKRGLDDIL